MMVCSVGRSVGWLVGWWSVAFFFVSAGAVFIHMLTRSERVDKLQFAEPDPTHPHRTLYIAATTAVIFIAANVVSLVLCLHQETTFPFFRLNYTSVIWNQFSWLTTSTITLMYVSIGLHVVNV